VLYVVVVDLLVNNDVWILVDHVVVYDVVVLLLVDQVVTHPVVQVVAVECDVD